MCDEQYDKLEDRIAVVWCQPLQEEECSEAALLCEDSVNTVLILLGD